MVTGHVPTHPFPEATIRAKTVETLEQLEHYSYPPPPFQCWKKSVKIRRNYAALKNIKQGVGGVSTCFGADCSPDPNLL